MRNTKILIFTDSRGQHVPSGYSHNVFAERIKDEYQNVDVELVLCPMKWTTTLDFIEYSQKHDLTKYDYVVLYTGIVEWSPRPYKSAINDLYNNKAEANVSNWTENTKDYSKKIINNKKKIFDSFFGINEMKKHFNNSFDTVYENEPTINMYSLEMAEKIGLHLAKIDNLIYINANRIVAGWDGDFKRGRPENISITHKYCDVVSNYIPQKKLIDLRAWNLVDIEKYTCDNMHLTNKGSNWILESIAEKLSLVRKSNWDVTQEHFQKSTTKEYKKLLNMRNLETFKGAKKDQFVNNYTDNQYLATLIIGFRLNKNDPSRIENLLFLLEWIGHFYSDMFDVLLVEQDSKSRIDQTIIQKYPFVRHEQIYNDQDYNRGWGYNVAVKHFCQNSKVVVLMDTDVLPGSNFVAEIRDCYINKYKVISPYQNIYYTEIDEVATIKKTFSFSTLNKKENIKNPVTITGGIVIFDKKTYLELKGFEQYIGYGCEDRALDVMILELCEKEKIKISPEAYIHLWHPTDKSARGNFKKIYEHLKVNYKCEWSGKLDKLDFIHNHCEHVNRDQLTELLIAKNESFGLIDLYKNDGISVNGRLTVETSIDDDILLPPSFTDLNSYKEKEIYDAPDADVEQLEKFRNAFLGKRCFIIGNGPSLNKHDLKLLENEYTFGVNSFYYKTRESGFRPTFYVVEDTSVMKENLKEIKDYYAPFKFFPTIYKRLHPKDPNTNFFTMNRGFYEKSSPNYCVPRFSTDATKELFCGQSVTYINLQLAYFMGFTEVHLIGMDFSYIIPDSHKRTGDVLLSDSDDENHFHKDYFGKGKTWKDPKLERVGNNYRMAKLVFESTGRKVYNATVGGSLEIFDRINYESLFHTNKPSAELILGDFKDANSLFAKGQYVDALIIYLQLSESLPDFVIYKQSLLNCYFKAIDTNQPIQIELIDRIKKFI